MGVTVKWTIINNAKIVSTEFIISAEVLFAIYSLVFFLL